MAYTDIPSRDVWMRDTSLLRTRQPMASSPRLQAIDKLISDYKPMSPEAGLIVKLNSLDDAIDDWCRLDSGGGPLPLCINDLWNVVEVLLEKKQGLPGYHRWLRKRANSGMPVDAHLREIDDLLKKYCQAKSDDTRRNLIPDLNDEIGQWMSSHPGNYADMVNLQKRIQPKLPVIPHPYRQVLCIGYVFDTSTYPKVPPMVPRPGKSYGDMLNEMNLRHMQDRCKNLVGAITAAHAGVPHKLRTDKSILKIFMAPEFYFRGHGGAYPNGVVRSILPNLDKELGLTQGKYPDWLFLFGTAVAATRVYLCPTCNKPVRSLAMDKGTFCCVTPACRPRLLRSDLRVKGEIDNVALLQKGSWRYIVEKEYVSRQDVTDFVSNKVDLVADGEIETAEVMPPEGSRDDDSVASSKWDDERMGGDVFTLDGIRMGVEICLDHVVDSVAGGAPKKGRLQGTKHLKVQLIPSEGMSMKNNSCMPKGILFNVDGHRPGAAAWVVDPANLVPDSTGTRIAAAHQQGQLTMFGPFTLP